MSTSLGAVRVTRQENANQFLSQMRALLTFQFLENADLT
jgi:hypothetical protein